MDDTHKLARAMCSIDLAESHWTQDLPRLPVPDLWLTVSRYLASLKSILAPVELTSDRPKLLASQLSDAQLLSNRKQFERTERLVNEFMLSQGPELQRDLKEYANKCQNWATEFWLHDMYLSNALPLPVNSNPFFLFPRQTFANSNEMLMFATRIIQFSVDFKYRIDQQSLRQDFGSGHGKGKALCMETYKNFFHSYRMPHEDLDRLLPQSRRSNHIVVASCDQFYILRLGQEPLDNPYRRDAGTQLNETSIFEQLLRIYRVSREHARRDQANGGAIPKVGLFTTENRKEWARAHKKLCRGSANNPNIDSLRQIEDCLFVMCLDSLVSSSSPPQSLRRDGVQDECAQNEHDDVLAATRILTGGGSNAFTANRWFDKFLQIIVGRDGVCGINIEHSASEGITVLRFLEEFLEFVKSNPIAAIKPPSGLITTIQENESDEQAASRFSYNTCVDKACATSGSSITSPSYVEPKSPSALLEESDKITPLKWTLNDELLELLAKAESNANKLISNFSLHILKFNHFGRKFIKRQNLSPDAFVQLALQYTFFKLHGQLVSTYESASLRQFRLGRVDNIRANTCEAFEWIQAMLACCEPHSSSPLRFKPAEASFVKAITRQVEILRYTIVGGAPDNHLLALRELAKIRYGADELPALFCDDSYREFLNFRLSTSQLPNESNITVGYGAVTQDGYGCSYNPCEDRIVFCVSSFVDCPLTSSSRFAAELEKSLLEMQQLLLDRTTQTETKSV